VHLDQHGEPEVRRTLLEGDELRIGERGDDEQIASAPMARDSATWYSSTMKSLRSAGRRKRALPRPDTRSRPGSTCDREHRKHAAPPRS
jgi:hypothetical protein